MLQIRMQILLLLFSIIGAAIDWNPSGNAINFAHSSSVCTVRIYFFGPSIECVSEQRSDETLETRAVEAAESSARISEEQLWYSKAQFWSGVIASGLVLSSVLLALRSVTITAAANKQTAKALEITENSFVLQNRGWLTPKKLNIRGKANHRTQIPEIEIAMMWENTGGSPVTDVKFATRASGNRAGLFGLSEIYLPPEGSLVGKGAVITGGSCSIPIDHYNMQAGNTFYIAALARYRDHISGKQKRVSIDFELNYTGTNLLRDSTENPDLRSLFDANIIDSRLGESAG